MITRPHVVLVRPAALTTVLKPSTVVTPPIGVAYLAGALQAAGARVTVVDAVGEAPQLVRRLAQMEYRAALAIGLSVDETVAQVPRDADLIGVSSMFSSSWPHDRRLIDALRRRFPTIPIVVGGEHATACWDYVLRTCPSVTACVLGEGEDTLVALWRALAEQQPWKDIAGLALRRGAELHLTPRRARLDDLEAIARPAWSLLPIEAYLSNRLGHGTSRERTMPLLATRGCPYTCSFCSSPQMWTTRWKAREPSALVDEMADYVAAHDVTNFDLYDLTTIVDRRWTLAFAAELIARKLGVTYQLASGSRTEAIDDEVALQLARSGCTHITFAPESGSEEAIARHRKRVRLAHMESALRACTQHGITVSLNFILFPDDTIQDVLATWQFALRCGSAGAADMSYFPYLPYPGSALYESLRTAGRLPPLSDAFLAELLDQFDLTRSHSYNARFSDWVIQSLRLSVVGSFVTASLLNEPRKLTRMVTNLGRGRPATRLEKNAGDVARRLGAVWRSNRGDAGARPGGSARA